MPQYNNATDTEVQHFMDSVGITPTTAQVDTDKLIRQLTSQSVPEPIDAYIDSVATVTGNGDRARDSVAQALSKGVDAFITAHGRAPTADVITHAIKQGHGYLDSVSGDSVAGTEHNSLSMQANRAVVATRVSVATAIPFAAYLPQDIGSNEGKIIIASHDAIKALGLYPENGNIDGANAGKRLISPQRVTQLDGNGNGKITANMVTPYQCDPDGMTVPLLKSRTQIRINGVVVATSASESNVEVFSNTFKIESDVYAVSGSITMDTGEVNAKFTPELPENTLVQAVGFVDIEKDKDMRYTPQIGVTASKKSVFAAPYRLFVEVTPESRKQFQNEIGIDPATDGMAAAQRQALIEDHYTAIKDAMVIGLHSNYMLFNFNAADQMNQKTASEIMKDLRVTLNQMSQKMAMDNGSHGGNILYADEKAAALLASLDGTIFVSSGLPKRPYVYRLGRLDNQYEVYFAGNGLLHMGGKGMPATNGRLVMIGANQEQVSFNPFVAYSPYAPTVKQFDNANQVYLMTGSSVIQPNPFTQYAKSCGVVDILNAI